MCNVGQKTKANAYKSIQMTYRKEVIVISDIVVQSKIVTIENFHSYQLSNDRTIFVYLPPSYKVEENKRYPVLYMNDGQNIFNPSVSTNGRSWNIHKTVDTLIQEKKISEIIIVGIAFKERVQEYSYYTWNKKRIVWGDCIDFEYSISGKGEQYQNFLIEELKPYIDKTFRTMPDKENTAFLGSSDGAFITFNIGLRRPDIFGMIGMMSPAFFAMDFEFLERVKQFPDKMWFDIGEKEPCLLDYSKKVVDILIEKGCVDGQNLMYYEVPDGFHSEKDWGARVNGPLIYFFGQIGEPIAVKMQGRDKIGPEETLVRINTILTYDSGLVRSDLSTNYYVEDKSILTISTDGTISPKMEGETRVSYHCNHIEASRVYRIQKGITKDIFINFKIKVPENTPKEAMIGADTYSPLTLVMKKISEGYYQGTFHVPRGLKINYRIKMMHDNHFHLEKDTNHCDIPLRELCALEDTEVLCVVDNWGRI